MPRLFIGLPALKGKLERYAERYDLVELRPVDTPLPRAPKLEAWRASVPPAFAFSVVLPQAVAALEPSDEALATSLEVARVLQARAIVLATTPAVRPTQKNRDRIAALAERLPRAGPLLAWHAMGMWEPEDVMETAYKAGFLPVFDAAQEALPPGPLVYTRIRAIGQAARLGTDRIQRIADQLAGRREAFVVVDEIVAPRVKRGLEQMVGDAPARRGVPLLFRPENGMFVDDEEQ